MNERKVTQTIKVNYNFWARNEFLPSGSVYYRFPLEDYRGDFVPFFDRNIPPRERKSTHIKNINLKSLIGHYGERNSSVVFCVLK